MIDGWKRRALQAKGCGFMVLKASGDTYENGFRECLHLPC